MDTVEESGHITYVPPWSGASWLALRGKPVPAIDTGALDALQPIWTEAARQFRRTTGLKIQTWIPHHKNASGVPLQRRFLHATEAHPPSAHFQAACARFEDEVDAACRAALATLLPLDGHFGVVAKRSFEPREPRIFWDGAAWRGLHGAGKGLAGGTGSLGEDLRRLMTVLHADHALSGSGGASHRLVLEDATLGVTAPVLQSASPAAALHLVLLRERAIDAFLGRAWQGRALVEIQRVGAEGRPAVDLDPAPLLAAFAAEGLRAPFKPRSAGPEAAP